MKMVILGPPGAGKGTQAGVITKKLRIPAISTGDILREAVARATPVGMKAKAYMDAGELVPDDVIIGILKERISREDCEGGFILDGVPRTIVQAEALSEQGVKLDAVLSIEVSDDDILERLGGRRACPECSLTYHVESNPPKAEGICDSCGAALITRHDDARETILRRLEAYHAATEPLKEYYNEQGILKTVDSCPEVSDTIAAVFDVLGIE